MIDTIFGTKISQSHAFTYEGKRIPVTNIKTGALFIVDIKTKDKDGYDALQLGIGTRRIKTVTKSILGHIKKAGLDKNPPRFLREIEFSPPEISDKEQLKLGLEINIANVLKQGDLVQISGTSKGKGFQGVVKRHHFRGGPRTHGQSDRERAPGSIGQTTTPGRVYKGKRMAGRMGNDSVTIKNLKVIAMDAEKKLLTVSGLVPGGRNSLLVIKKMNK